jgi:hypothetical protein
MSGSFRWGSIVIHSVQISIPKHTKRRQEHNPSRHICSIQTQNKAHTKHLDTLITVRAHLATLLKTAN